MAVYTEIDRATLARFLEGYEIGPGLALEGILQGIENSNFRLETPAGRFVLTVFERRAATADLPYFLGLMAHLADAGFPAPRPIPRRDGQPFGRIAGKPAAIVTFLDGDWPQTPSPADAHAAGAALAGLHVAGQSFAGRRANDLGPAAWRGLFARSADRADTIEQGLAREIESALDRIERDWPAGLPAGAIHADLFPDNLFLTDGRVTGVIDFYFACDDAYAYDLAIMLNAWTVDAAGRASAPHAAALTAGYESIRTLAPAERTALPVLRAGGALRFLLTRLYDWLHPQPGALQRPKDPLEQRAVLRACLAAIDDDRPAISQNAGTL